MNLVKAMVQEPCGYCSKITNWYDAVLEEYACSQECQDILHEFFIDALKVPAKPWFIKEEL